MTPRRTADTVCCGILLEFMRTVLFILSGKNGFQSTIEKQFTKTITNVMFLKGEI